MIKYLIKLSTYLAITILLAACRNDSPKYTHDVGYIDPETALGEKNFATCDNEIFQYHNAVPHGGYKYGKKALRDTVRRKYKTTPGESGYLTFRFVVNCEGKAGWYNIIENDLDLTPKHFDKELTAHLFELTQDLKEWRPLIFEDKPRDYYMYITYKLVDGEIREILP